MDETRQQDIVWVRFPFSNMQDSKFRPALVLSHDSYNKNSLDIVACSITSKLGKKEFSVLIDDSNLSRGKMTLKSNIRADKVSSIEKDMIVKSFARLNDETYDLVVDEIDRLIKRSVPEKTAKEFVNDFTDVPKLKKPLTAKKIKKTTEEQYELR